MKKVLSIILIMFVSNVQVKASEKWGEGELQLTRGVVNYFIKYLRGNTESRPLDFYVSTDGTYAMYWFCPTGGACQEGNYRTDIEKCNKASGKTCRKFAVRRTIKWQNGINPAKGKASKINSRWSDEEIFAKLTELGFYNNNFSKKDEKKEQSNEISNQIEKLNDLYKSGVLTKEEFEKAKKKILN